MDVSININCFFMNSLVRFDEVIAKFIPFVPKISHQKFASLKIEHLILSIALKTTENGIGEEF